jgi:hypothetical protein
MDFVFDFIVENELDVFVIGETWLVPSVSSSFVEVHEFSVVRGDTHSGIRKHGVCMYVKNSLNYEEVNLQLPNVAAVFLINLDVWILSVYRPPSYGDQENLDLVSLINDFCVGREVVVLGDFNLPSVRWPEDAVQRVNVSRTDQLFLDCFAVCGLHQWVSESTFVSSGNVLDLFLTSELDRVGDVEVLAPLPRCSHSPVICDYLFENVSEPDDGTRHSLRYSWHRGNYGAISEALSRVDWPLEFVHLDVDEAYSVFLDILRRLIDLHVPLAGDSPKVPWSVRPPHEMKVRKAHAWNEYKISRGGFGRNDHRTLEALAVFHDINHQFRNYVLASRSQYEEYLMHRYSESPKLFHAYVRRKKKGRLGVGPLRNPAGQLVDSPLEMAELLASAFSSIYREDIPPNPAPFQAFDGQMSEISISPHDVFGVLAGLNINSAMGLDGLHPKLLRECAVQLTQPLCILFNQSLHTGLLPDAWKNSLVVPIFKSKSRYDPQNYRPVSLTSVCCKSMERIVAAELVSYLESHHLLSSRQFGFRRSRSAEDQMLLVYSEVVKSVDAGLVVDVALLDFSKAFDVVSHPILLLKLQSLGVSEVLLRWVGGFLDSRIMCVGVDRVNSEPRDVKSGVPQGSVLGPILFLIYVNFLTDSLVSEFGAFADDFKIYLSFHHHDVVGGMSSLQEDLDRVYRTASSWNLSLNPNKCVVLRFRRRFAGCIGLGAGAVYTLGGSCLEFVQVHRDLGVHVDVSLRFHEHVRGVVRRAAGLCSDLLRSTVNRSPDFMIALFVTHVRPILDYCSCVWNLGYVQDMNLLESVQRRWTKQVRGLSELSYRDRLTTLGLFSIRGRLLRTDLIKYWRILCCDTEGFDLSILFQRSLDGRTRGHRHKLLLPLCSVDIAKRFFNVRCIKIWNELPADVVESSGVSAFKARLAEYLGDRLFEY